MLLTTPVPTAPANNTTAAAAERVRMRVDMNFPSERNRRHSAPNPESRSGQQTVAGIRVTLTEAEDELAVDEAGVRWRFSTEAAGSGSATAQDCVPTVEGAVTVRHDVGLCGRF
ncbi:hypothetical protein [Micromonospora narathiwatensis]|uniref:hypothetical protein n=1 Tax=Micromonospora narathiwatensis TaxID=299146 RepID=UPI0014309766|nr:hypothetical protein [Micromonospora narathiwatensis]